ncbi:2-oxoglutarate dehydrogenase E1 component [Leptospira sp. 2 VSF19]|uniref:oxoglutarate dehydrogenase (succinyl-transferring) n=1 Tax=Leptospira soteropolitanensis TaxID=2950025 RepID=A0AAW5VPE6_9LEPT|nr:2-oxoglutarate dehydrogenase E1 component [Leptospira soteropolitanensis]MCW7493824.1 2-oxoglutarate dehydrogenase E1 component [Leptospira soteropolitanensis]MCW7501419.1 2-oxoglutarate dehydrogenase E1 component [Leptospira soteropolitanensis]MCW7523818.1 2-oxoglutarate dehydrogenase E1 component [Leptospira soteropolitanensis]MCW7527683.1 2-oxoglutarate dehydrogenase E1 component [Leptospira soteropolitanensis]MCW7531536.1 2-oxoglutarate dehydrogenase E1 component [Leptospira soteropolit
MTTDQMMSLYGDNVVLLEEYYKQFKEDPQSLSKDWIDFFGELERSSVSGNGSNGNGFGGNGYVNYASTEHRKDSSLSDFGIINLLNAYRRQGHLAANLDPLGINKPNREFIDLKIKALKQSDLETEVDSGIANLGKAKLKDVIDWFEKTYCGSIGCEHYYLVNDEEREWLQNRMEPLANSEPISKKTALRLFEKLYQADSFENFLAKKFVGKKRFSLEGGETMIPMLDTLVEEAGGHKMDALVIGMAHRGRLNVLVNIIRKPAGLIFAEFEEKLNPGQLGYADVKYHLGYSNHVMTHYGKEVKLSLAFNPSHLEAVDPVIFGSVRARQEMAKDMDRSKFMPVAIHGDAAFAGQGVVAETLNMMNLEGYTVGGTFHIVINNQIGFTTLPSESRSTLYATDLAKGFQVPIFHVNGDDPEATYRVTKLALEYRQKFKKDVIIDLICYRRLGHNETDEPTFTQPQMYDIIKKHPKTISIYEEKLLQRGDITPEEIQFIKDGIQQGLETSFQQAKEKDTRITVDTLGGVWSRYTKEPLDSDVHTELLQQQLGGIVKAVTTLPQGFNANPKHIKVLEDRKKMGAGELPIDWGFAESLSFGSILENGFPIRLGGQDAQRGTFSHRHATLSDIVNGKKLTLLNHISDKQAKIEIVNSSLSEYSCLGFEYGYSLADPSSLVMWEAQFGDFANNAQVIFDQFISSSEIKWQRMSGLVCLLPHGYEGQGPEHSSARLERFLQLCALDNIQVANLTTPAQYFHILRRQILQSFRKPLIIMTPKSLLRLKEAASSLEDITTGAFRKILPDPVAKPEKVEKLLFCSGKVYYDLRKAIDTQKLENVAVVRIEQLYPFPENHIKQMITSYGKLKKFVWVQEEPKNQGAWFFVRDRIEAVMPENKRLHFAGRSEFPSPACGHVVTHLKEQEDLVKDALS